MCVCFFSVCMRIPVYMLMVIAAFLKTGFVDKNNDLLYRSLKEVYI